MAVAVPRVSTSSRTATSPASTGDTVVRLTGLTKRFPVQRGWLEMVRRPFGTEWATAVDDVTFSVATGEFFGLLGPNGAGKTTLFKILATLVLPDAGAAVVGGYDVARKPAAVRRLLAPVIADERSLHWRISARENLRLFAALHGVASGENRARVDELLAVVGLEDARDKLVGKFSSGMKQRLLIARGLIARPKVLLLDEPTRSLDPVSAREFRQFLRREIAGVQGCTVLLATHNTEEALELCDRVAILDRGRLLAVGAPSQLATDLERDRYRLWTTQPRHRSFATLLGRGAIGSVAVEEEGEDDWTAVVLEISGGPPQVADVLAFLVENRVPISGLERTRLSLADLIARVIETNRETKRIERQHA
jgi:ABC-2 type transport system ATP-binding protein